MERLNLQHVAIIMDGNGRWAQARGLARLAGHHRGAAAVRRIVTDCPWPDFGPEDFDRAVAWYHKRTRTFGLVEATG
jgi:undecaprenyl pyrophosphate synthase